MTKRHHILAIILYLNLFTPCHADPSLTWKEITIPLPNQPNSQGLETLIVWPDDGHKHPLALINHGSPRNPKDRIHMTALSYLPIAQEFARRGYTAAIVLRRGYGHSGGAWVEQYGTCQAPDYFHTANEASQDLHTAISYLNTLPQVDDKTMIAVGHSAGGVATIALTAIDPPTELKAAISFAGGRGSTSADHVCGPDVLVATFGTLGKTSRTPMLWIYAKNDHFFNPALAKKLFAAFTENGGKATFIAAPAYGSEGHFLFSVDGIPIWSKYVDEFLKSQDLIFTDHLFALPTPIEAPASLPKAAKGAFVKYQAAAPHKAFAISSDGAYGWRSGQASEKEAKNEAMETCEKYSSGTTCRVIVVDNVLVK